MLKLLIVQILAFLVLMAWSKADAESRLRYSELPYAGGKARFDAVSADNLHRKLGGQFLETPLVWKNSQSKNQSKKFDLFYFLSEPFNPSLPTVVYINGGPGGNSIEPKLNEHLPGFNFLYFDQRGTGYSHLRTEDDQMNPENFSSVAIAKDIEFLRRHLGIAKLAVYGQSYGTVVGTIYAHLFPKSTSALVLEGVVFDGTLELWQAPLRLRLLQKFFDSLPEDLRTKILALSTRPDINEKSWFSLIAQQEMYENNFEQRLLTQLKTLSALRESETVMSINQLTSRSGYTQDSLYFGAVMFHQIGCQELSRGLPAGVVDAVFVDGKLVPSSNAESAATCMQIPGLRANPARLARTYYSTRYPVRVPVTYFQGATDGATVATNAIKHLEQTSKGPAQLVLVKDAGHGPVINCLSTFRSPDFPIKENCNATKEIAEVFSLALRGQKIPDNKLTLIPGPNLWRRTTRSTKVVLPVY